MPDSTDDQEYYRLLVQGVEDYAIFGMDANGIVTSWNTGAQRIKGYSAEEIIGQSYDRFYSKEDRAAGIPRRMLKSAAELGHVQAEGWRVRKDGSRFWAEVTITALHDKAGRLTGFAKVTRDVTERKQAEGQLATHAEALEKQVRERTAELTRANADLESFSYSVSHDLRTPLRSIDGFSRLLEEELAPVLDDKAKDRIARIRAATQRMGDLIDALLDLSRVSRAELRSR